MKKEIIATGRNVEDAVRQACEQLEVSREQVEVEVLEIQKKSFFGLKIIPAKVRVTCNPTKVQLAVEYIEQVLDAMEVHAQIHVDEQPSGALIRLEGGDLGVIIGRRGETLDALQYLASLVANRADGEYFRITIDSGNFREKREKTLQALAAKIASQAIKAGHSVTLEPMNPYERRIIHSTIQEIQGVSSTSLGEEPHRCVVVTPANARKTVDSRGPRRDNFRHGPHPNGTEERGSRPPKPPYRREERPKAAAIPTAGPTVSREEKDDAPDKPLYSKIEL